MKVFVFGLLAVLIGCGEKPAAAPREGAQPPAPKITHFYGNQAVVPKGESLTLCYGTENADSLTLAPAKDGDLRPSFNRCVSETPAADTTYTLTAKGPGGQTSASFSVRVGAAAPAAAKERHLIENFTVLGKTPVSPGGRIQLCYSTAGAGTVSVQPSAGGALRPGKNQCFAVNPDKTTNYVLTATASDGGVDRMQVTVAVQ